MGDLEHLWRGLAGNLERNRVKKITISLSSTPMQSHTRQYIIQRVSAVFLLLTCVHMAAAQELEYKMELGGMAGGCFYLGDANYLTPFKHTAMAGGVLARYNFNPRMAVKGDLAIGRIKGTTEGQANKFPYANTAFSRNVYELSSQFEYNFFAYGTGAGYKDSRKLAPYIQAGFGLTYAPKPVHHVLALNIPMGIGVKYKLAHRLNVGAEWTIRFTTSDRLDVTQASELQLDDPYGIESKGLKNKDSYSMLMLYISYDMFPKYRKCNN